MLELWIEAGLKVAEKLQAKNSGKARGEQWKIIHTKKKIKTQNRNDSGWKKRIEGKKGGKIWIKKRNWKRNERKKRW